MPSADCKHVVRQDSESGIVVAHETRQPRRGGLRLAREHRRIVVGRDIGISRWSSAHNRQTRIIEPRTADRRHVVIGRDRADARGSWLVVPLVTWRSIENPVPGARTAGTVPKAAKVRFGIALPETGFI